MKISIPKEVKNREYRVAITPAGVHELVAQGHDVYIETGAGLGSSITDKEYEAEGAKILDTADETWEKADMVLKVKEPIPEEYHRLRDGLILFTYLHLAADKALTKELMKKNVHAIAYETVEGEDGSLPLLAPMSIVAGRLSAQVASYTLMKAQGGRGVLMGGVPGTHPANVVVIGGGVAGENAISMAVGLHANVTVLDTNVRRLAELDHHYEGRIQTIVSNKFELEQAVSNADVVIGAVLVKGAKAPKLVSNELVSKMQSGSVLVDIAIDQGGCFEDSKPTTHDNPTFKVHDSVFYCVANMPGAVPRTSTYALTNVTLPYIIKLAHDGLDALDKDPSLAKGLNVSQGVITCKEVAESHPDLVE
ncbi:MAG: alanine dehydrogenase [Micrococcaceae bacterium]